MPCKSAKARHLLKEGKAKVVRVKPFTIQLKVATGETKQPVVVGIDDGVKNAGVAVVSHGEVVLKGNIKLRDNVRRLMTLRRERRRQRRRSLRHRQPRHLNNDWEEGWLPPSLKVRKENILRVVREIAKLMPVSLIRVEQAMFDVAQLASDTDLVGGAYQKGLAQGWENRKHAVLFRDSYICQYCRRDMIKEGLIAEVDHILPKSRGGKDTFKNLVAACRECNQAKGEKAAAEFGYPNLKGADFSVPSLLNAGKTYLFERLSKIARTEKCFGYETKEWRKRLGLEKAHYTDALAIAVEGRIVRDLVQPIVFIARRRNRDMFNLKVVEFAGLRHWDVVRVVFKRGKRKGQCFLGTVRAFVPGRNLVKVRFPFEDNCGVSLPQVSLVQRSKGVILC